MNLNFVINPNKFTSAFVLPCSLVDENLALAEPDSLKVLLFVMRHLDKAVDIDYIKDELSLSYTAVEEALLYWKSLGYFVFPTDENAKPEVRSAPVQRSAMPTRGDVAKRSDDSNVRLLLSESQNIFARELKSNEMTTLLWIYDDLGLDLSVIFMLLQHAKQLDRLNISYVKSTAISWFKQGATTISKAEELISGQLRRATAWAVVERCFGIERRKPSQKEELLSDKWLNDYKFSEDMLKYAYDTCVNAKSAFSMPYVSAIIDSWYKSGYTSVQQVKDNEGKSKKQDSYSSIDVEKINNMLRFKE